MHIYWIYIHTCMCVCVWYYCIIYGDTITLKLKRFAQSAYIYDSYARSLSRCVCVCACVLVYPFVHLSKFSSVCIMILLGDCGCAHVLVFATVFIIDLSFVGRTITMYTCFISSFPLMNAMLQYCTPQNEIIQRNCNENTHFFFSSDDNFFYFLSILFTIKLHLMFFVEMNGWWNSSFVGFFPTALLFFVLLLIAVEDF